MVYKPDIIIMAFLRHAELLNQHYLTENNISFIIVTDREGLSESWILYMHKGYSKIIYPNCND